MYFTAVCLCLNVGLEHCVEITIWMEMSYLVKVRVFFLLEYNLGGEIIWCAILNKVKNDKTCS